MLINQGYYNFMAAFALVLFRTVLSIWRGIHPMAATVVILAVFCLAKSSVPRAVASDKSEFQAERQAAPRRQKPSGPTTTDLSFLRLTRNVLTVRLEKGFYEVMDMFEFENTGKATIVSKNGAPTLRFQLPVSDNIRNPNTQIAAAPQGLNPNFLRFIGNHIVSTEPIQPGRKLVVLVYRMADEFGGIMVEKPIVYGTKNFAVLPEKDRVQLGMHSFIQTEPVRFHERDYDRFTGATQAGAKVRFHFKAPDSTAKIPLFYAVGGGVFAVGAVTSLWIRRRRNANLARRMEREGLFIAIADLDDKLALGKISQEEHSAQRAPHFDRLRQLSR